MNIAPITVEEIDAEAFHAKVGLPVESGCTNWLGQKTAKGYGRFVIDGRQRMAHRISYLLAFGSISTDDVIDHLCRNKSCVNPFHLEAVSTQQNTARGEAGSNMRSVTHCPAGHAYDEQNTVVYSGRRHCLTCRREQQKRSAKERYWLVRDAGQCAGINKTDGKRCSRVLRFGIELCAFHSHQSSSTQREES